MATRIKTGALAGIDGLAVTAEVDISRGLPGFHLVGLPGAEVRESRDRVMAALRHSGIRLPIGKITVNLAPAGIRKEGASFDLAIALGVVAANDPASREGGPGKRSQALFIGELSLFGELRPVRGLLAIVLAAVRAGETRVVVPAEQAWEACLVDGIDVVGVASLTETVRWWRTGQVPRRDGMRVGSSVSAGSTPGMDQPDLVLAGLEGQPLARKAAVLAATGGHHLLMVGPPGSGKTRLARILGRLQAPLKGEKALEVTRIHSAAGLLDEAAMMTRRPFRSPHHTVTRAGLAGGGGGPRPGEVTLAHGGLLFLDEFPLFSPGVLDVLREPLEEGSISLVRGGGRHVFPADFQLVAAMNPCRCGFLGSPHRKCRCGPGDRARYLARLSGPLLDRFDIVVEVGPWEGKFLTRGKRGNPPARANARVPGDWRNRPTRVDVTSARKQLVAWGKTSSLHLLTSRAASFLDESRAPLGLSLRGVKRCVAVARTVAALDGQENIRTCHVREALEYRREMASLAGAEA